MMKKLVLGFLMATGLIFSGCTANQSSKDTVESTTEEPAPPEEEVKEEPVAAPAPTPLEDGNFETSVLKDGIASPRKQMRGKIGEAIVTINYGSPSVKGREVWGGLVPFGKVWRTGANEATSFEVSKDVQIGGSTLPAGKYGFFTLPEASKCTVIFNEDFEQWGSGNYTEGKDVLRVEVPTQKVDDTSETMEFMVKDDQVILQWDKLQVPMKVSAG